MIEKMETIYFNGIWKIPGRDDVYIFTDGVTKGTFTVQQGEDFIEIIRDRRARFGRLFPDRDDMIFERE